MKKVLGLTAVLAVAQVAQAANIEAGKELAATVCAACHGANGVSVSDAMPNLAAQRAAYIEAQLKVYKDGTRKPPGATSHTDIMNAIPAQRPGYRQRRGVLRLAARRCDEVIE